MLTQLNFYQKYMTNNIYVDDLFVKYNIPNSNAKL